MSIIVKDTGAEFARPEPGMQQAVCSHVYDLGMQPGYQGAISHKLVILWELEERIKEGEYAGQRFVISKFYTASLNEKANLRNDLVAWRGRDFTPDELKGFDIEKIVGANCYVNLVEKKKTDGRTAIVVASIAPFKQRPDGPAPMVPELARDYVPDWIKKLLDKPTQPDTSDIEPNDIVPF